MTKEEMNNYLVKFNAAFSEDGFDCDCPAVATKDQVLEELNKDMYANEPNKKMVEKSDAEYFIMYDFGAVIEEATEEAIQKLLDQK
ncbi:hypothetical protein AKUH4B210M_09590 [Apilactobacillus kunkeei]|nr:hypothetical protein AKUH4B210M_09590 [Apilactobacillus kunkeei]